MLFSPYRLSWPMVNRAPPPTIAVNVTLQFDVELLSWLSINDICKDGGVFKNVLKEGEKWENPKHHDEVFVKYEARLQDGTVVAKSDGVEFIVDDGHFCPPLAKAVKTMKKGEKVLLTVKPQWVKHGCMACDCIQLDGLDIICLSLSSKHHWNVLMMDNVWRDACLQELNMIKAPPGVSMSNYTGGTLVIFTERERQLGDLLLSNKVIISAHFLKPGASPEDRVHALIGLISNTICPARSSRVIEI